MTGTYTQVFKAEGAFGAGCPGSQAGQAPEEENTGINLDLAYCL